MEAVQLAYDVYETDEARSDKCPIVVLHGLFWNKHMFGKVAKALCIATKRKVFCVDLRCHDQSSFREECSTELMTEDVKRFIKDRGLPKVCFVCHSFSCTIAYLIAVDQPDVVEKLVLVDHPPFQKFKEEIYKERVYYQFSSQHRFLNTLDLSLSLLAAKKKILSLAEGASEGQKIFLQKVAYDLTKVDNQFRWKTDHEFLIKKYHDREFSPPARGSSNHEILLIRCENSPRLTHVCSNLNSALCIFLDATTDAKKCFYCTKYVSKMHSWLRDEKFATVLRFNPNAKLRTMEDTTHLLMFEKLEEFVATVADFLA